MELQTEIAGISLEHPLMNAAGTCKTLEDVKKLSRSATAAVMVGSITMEPRDGNAGDIYWSEKMFSLNSLPNSCFLFFISSRTFPRTSLISSRTSCRAFLISSRALSFTSRICSRVFLKISFNPPRIPPPLLLSVVVCAETGEIKTSERIIEKIYLAICFYIKIMRPLMIFLY